MILEHAALPVRPGEEEAFERAFEEARGIIASANGCRSVQLSRCLERPSAYLLLVEWETLEDHVSGFRGSPAFARWRELLHHFYEPAAVVEHYTTIA